MPRMPILLLDGGLGTTLEGPPYQIQFSPATPLWSSHLLLSSPSTLEAVHRAFVDAGADIILTATYQTSIEGFARTDAKHTVADAVRCMRSAIPLARAAFFPSAAHQTGRVSEPRKPIRVALSLGPYGATMTPVAAEYSGLYPPEMDSEPALREWHARRAEVFARHGASWGAVEYVAFETVRRADEGRAIRGAVRDAFQQPRMKRMRWWISGVFPAEDVDEEAVRRWVRAVLQTDGSLPRPWGIGVNCTRVGNVAAIVGIMEDEVAALVARESFVDEWDASSGRPWLVLYPDGTKGEEYDPATKRWVEGKREAPQRPWEDALADVVGAIVQRANWEGLVVGGCCQTGPREITALRKKIEEIAQ